MPHLVVTNRRVEVLLHAADQTVLVDIYYHIIAFGSAGRRSITPSGGGVEVPTLLFAGRRLLVRLFNAEGNGEERAVPFSVRPSRVELVELDGRTIRPLPVQSAGGGRYEVRLASAFRNPHSALRTGAGVGRMAVSS